MWTGTSDCSFAWGEHFSTEIANFHTYSGKKGVLGDIGICGAAWGCMGIAGTGYKFFCGDEKEQNNCHAIFLAWGAPHSIFMFVWVGFMWVCDTEVL